MSRRKMALVVGAIVVIAGALMGGSILTSRREMPRASTSAEQREPSATQASVGVATATARPSGEPTAERDLTSTSTTTATASSAAPAPKDAPLAVVDSPPARTLAFVEPSAAQAGDSYTVAFAPYGYGPRGKSRALIVRIDRSTPVGKPQKVFALEGRNVLLDVANSQDAQAIEKGGTYTGTVVFGARGGGLVLTLENLR